MDSKTSTRAKGEQERRALQKTEEKVEIAESTDSIDSLYLRRLTFANETKNKKHRMLSQGRGSSLEAESEASFM